MLKPLHGFAELLGDTFGTFQVDGCAAAAREGRDWHVRTHGYCFPFDERREFVWHATKAEVDELIHSRPTGTVHAFQHKEQPRTFNQLVTEQPQLIWDVMGIPVFNR